MKVPLSWLKEFVEIDISIGELTRRLTLAGLEIEEVRYVGLPLPEENPKESLGSDLRPETSVSGLAWDPEKIVVGAILEVMPHPNADRLVLCRLDDGRKEHIVLTGAPNLFQYKGSGALETPLKVAFATEGARIYDGHKPGWELMTLKRAKIRGVESYSMACSEKELGISEDHEGIIILDDDAQVGMPLVDYMGDAVLDINITPNIARNANILGVAREVSALTGKPLLESSYEVPWSGPPIDSRVNIDIRNLDLNPRFVLGLIEGVTVQPSPYWIQHRLRLAGMRPINTIVDATNYVMLEIGEPLHAFDYDILVDRAGGSPPTIITRLPEKGEGITTLDGVDRDLDDFTVLVADTAGPLSIAGVMGGAETEVSERTTNVLLEGAAWNYINIRRTVAAQKISSDAAYRFERGIHPAMTKRGVSRCLTLMANLTGGEISTGLVDAYPLPHIDPVNEITPADIDRWLGIQLDAEQIANFLGRLGFGVEVTGQVVKVTTPDHRLDIGEGVVGVADLVEEVARIYGYDCIPETQISDTIPPQYGNPLLDQEERVRDLLVGMGLQEVVTYRMTSEEREGRLGALGLNHEDRPYVRLINPIISDRVVMRQSLLASVLEVVERNARVRERIAVFEIGPVYLLSEEESLPEEPLRVAIALTGQRAQPGWQASDTGLMDFFDLKGIVSALLMALHFDDIRYEPIEYPTYHPGKCARVLLGERGVGMLGELHPMVHERFDFPETPLVVAELDLEVILAALPETYAVRSIPAFPPVFEDIAVVVEESVPTERVEGVIRQAGGALLSDVRLFDLYKGEQVGQGKKSLAFALIYQASDRTLTDDEITGIRKKIIEELDNVLGAKLRT